MKTTVDPARSGHARRLYQAHAHDYRNVLVGRLIVIALIATAVGVAGFGIKAVMIRAERERELDATEVIIPGTVQSSEVATVGRHQITITYTIMCQNAVIIAIQRHTGAILAGDVEVGVSHNRPRRVRAPGGPWIPVTDWALW
jgi:hypothetical protein